MGVRYALQAALVARWWCVGMSDVRKGRVGGIAGVFAGVLCVLVRSSAT